MHWPRVSAKCQRRLGRRAPAAVLAAATLAVAAIAVAPAGAETYKVMHRHVVRMSLTQGHTRHACTSPVPGASVIAVTVLVDRMSLVDNHGGQQVGPSAGIPSRRPRSAKPLSGASPGPWLTSTTL